MVSILIAVLATLGALFALIASIGIVKMPDFYSRLSITVKAATLGMGTILFSAAIFFNDFAVTSKSTAIVFFLILTAPIAGHIISKSAYITGIPLWNKTQMDELEGKYNKRTGVIEKQKESASKKQTPPAENEQSKLKD